MRSTDKRVQNNMAWVQRFMTLGEPTTERQLRNRLPVNGPLLSDRQLEFTLGYLRKFGHLKSEKIAGEGNVIRHTLISKFIPDTAKVEPVKDQQLLIELLNSLSTTKWLGETTLNPVGVALKDLVLLGLVKQRTKDGETEYQLLSPSNL